jgi:hypothetical protein
MEEQKTFRDRCKEGWDRHKKKVGVAVGVGASVVCSCVLAKKWDDVVKVAGSVLNSNTIQSIQEDVSKSVADNIAETVQEAGGLNMLVLGIVDTVNAKWCQITTGGRRYTCPVKVDNGEMFFRFKRAWHPISQFVSDHAEVLVQEGGKTFSKPFKQ